jgi:hypothetical protein
MSGIYVAKPAVVSVPDVPPGWTVGWAFPGPWPPGYIPEFTYNMSTGATYVPGATHAVTATLRDQVTYATKEPDAGITWKAKIAGTPIQLKFNGETEWSNSLSSDHSSVGDYYGAEPTFLFNVSADQGGAIIVLTAQSIPFNDQSDVESTSSVNIEVVSPPAYAIFESVATHSGFDESPSSPFPGQSYNNYLYIYGISGLWSVPTGFTWDQRASLPVFDPPQYQDKSSSDVENTAEDMEAQHQWNGLAPAGTIRMKILQLTAGEIYTVVERYQVEGSVGISLEQSFTLYDSNDNVIDGYPKTKSISWPQGSGNKSLTTWLTYDVDADETTIVNP